MIISIIARLSVRWTIWRSVQGLTSHVLFTKEQDLCPIQGFNMARLWSGWAGILLDQETREWSILQATKALMSMWMLHSQGTGIQRMQIGIQTLQGQELAMSSFMPHVQSFGHPSFSLRLLYQQQRVNIWQFQQPQEKCFHWWSWCKKCKIMDVVWQQQHQGSIVGFLRTTAAPLSWLQVSRIRRCVPERATSTPSTIISGTRFKMALSQFILSQLKTCLQISSPRSAMKRLTPSCASNWWVGNRRTSSSEWGSKRKATVMASTVVDHTLPLLPSVRQPKFLWVTVRFSFARLSHASRSRSRKCLRHCSSDIVECSADVSMRSTTASRPQKRTQTGASSNIHVSCFYISIYISGIQYLSTNHSTMGFWRTNKEQSKNNQRTWRTRKVQLQSSHSVVPISFPACFYDLTISLLQYIKQPLITWVEKNLPQS